MSPDFAESFAQRMERKIEPLSQENIRRLKSCGWPGNVRELQNVIERAVITSQSGRLNLDRALPETAKDMLTEVATSTEETSRGIHTVQELQELEKQNLIRALEEPPVGGFRAKMVRHGCLVLIHPP